MGARLAFAVALVLAPQPAVTAPTRLFADDRPIHFALRGPLGQIAATPLPSRAARPATLTLISPAAEQHSVLLSPRGINRRNRDNCTFPPLRVEFTAKPQPVSLFERQHRLKLVTHCRSTAGHQQFVLLEYAAYRLYGILTPTGLRVRLGSIDYSDQNGRGLGSRLGFFVEDAGDAARRNGRGEYKTTGRVVVAQLDPAASARAALFEYMIGNLDWSMRAGAPGDSCCHNFKFMGGQAGGQDTLVPVPYDFDSTGFVNAPYAVGPEALGGRSVRDRQYRGYCVHNAAALAVAAEFRAKRPELLAVLGAIPQLDERRGRAAAAYLEGFFRDIATDEGVRKKVLATCIS